MRLAGHDFLKSIDLTLTAVRHVLGAIAQFEKASLVAKRKAARDRRRAAAGKCEGRKSWAEINPELVHEAILWELKRTILGAMAAS